MYKMMNHPSEWAKFFDERAGHYRSKHKGSGVVWDTLVAIRKMLKRRYKAGKKLSKVVVEKGSDKIQRIPKKSDRKHQPQNRELPAKH